MAKRGRGKREEELLLSPSDGARVRASRVAPAAAGVPYSGPSQKEVNALMRQMGWTTANAASRAIAARVMSEGRVESGTSTTTTLGPGGIRPVAGSRGEPKGGPIRKGKGGKGR